MKFKPAFAATLMSLLAVSAQAGVVVDQSYTPVSSNADVESGLSISRTESDFRRAQTVVARVSGTLDSLDVFVYNAWEPFGGVHILDSIAGTGHIVATSNEYQETGNVLHFDLRALGIEVQAGQTYAFEVFGPAGLLLGNTYRQAYSGGADYIINPGAGYETFTRTVSDAYFVTRVNDPTSPIPEPEQVALLLAGLGVVAARARKRT